MKYLKASIRAMVMVFNATFNNASWRSVLLVEETAEYTEKITDLSLVTDKYII
jgi:hypothetical protein